MLSRQILCPSCPCGMWKGSNNTDEPGWTSLLTSIENFREVYEGCEEWLPLFPTFLLQLSEGEHHING